MTETTEPDEFAVEYYASAEKLITAACYMANKSLGHKLRNHWIDEFNKLLSEHEKRFPHAKAS